MLVPDWLLSLFIKTGIIKISPFNPEAINPNSLDVTLGQGFMVTKPTGKLTLAGISIIDPQQPDSFASVLIDKDILPLGPGEFVLSRLAERISLPSFICAEVVGRSSLGRLGLGNSHFAGFADSGWEGELVIELHNASKEYILLRKGMGIGQLVFHLHLPAFRPYGKKAKSKYQGQIGIIGSKGI